MKALDYLRSEYHYEEHDMEYMFGEDWKTLKHHLEISEAMEPNTELDEAIMIELIDDFFMEKVQMNKRRRRAY